MLKNKPARGSTPAPDHIMISFCGDAKSEMAVTWRTDLSVESGYVEYWSDGGEKLCCQSVTEVFESDIDISRMHWAHLENLKSGTRYYYTCGNETVRSEVFSFVTEEEKCEKFSFIAISDFQKGHPHDLPDYSGLNRFLKDVLKKHPDARFILSGGDSTDCGQHEVQWNGLFSGLTGIVENVPFMMSLGNHDNRGFKDYRNGIGRYYAEPAEFFGKQFKGSYPDNGPVDWKTENYSFNYGDAHFVIFGINGPEDVNEWAIRDINASDRAWTMGCYHFPIYYSGPENQNDDAYPVMRESMEMCDIMFSGHEHNFSRSYPIKNEEIFDRPSQGTMHYMLGNSHCNPPGSRTVSKVWHSAFYPQEEFNSMYALVEVEKDKVTLTSYIDDGRIADQCVIDRTTDTIYPYAVAPIYIQTRMLFKGMDLGLCQVTVPPVEKDGVWYIPAATLINYIGGEVSRGEGSVELEIYGHSARFELGKSTAQTDRGEITLQGEVFRGHREQLYVPAEDVARAFDMKWAYVKRNNFLSFEIATEDKPVPRQP